MMRLIKMLFSWIAKFLQNKKVQKTLFAGAAATTVVAVSEGAIVHKRNKRAERIKSQAIKMHDTARLKIDAELKKLGETKLEICNTFDELADMIEQIQQRPDVRLSVEGIELPPFQPSEFKRIAAAVEVAAGGLSGVAAGSAVGAAVMGIGSVAALAPGALAGGVVLCVMGAKMMGRAAERVEQAKQIAADVEKIIKFYEQLESEAKKFNDSLISVLKPYRAKLKKMHKILERKQNWENFSQKEKSVVENAILLAQLLCHMCSINLIKDATAEYPIERVNTPEISRAIADAKNVLKEVA